VSRTIEEPSRRSAAAPAAVAFSCISLPIVSPHERTRSPARPHACSLGRNEKNRVPFVLLGGGGGRQHFIISEPEPSPDSHPARTVLRCAALCVKKKKSPPPPTAEEARRCRLTTHFTPNPQHWAAPFALCRRETRRGASPVLARQTQGKHRRWRTRSRRTRAGSGSGVPL